MGIKDLSKFLRDRKINCHVENYALSNLKGYRVGIDANNFLFVQGAGIHKDAVYKSNNLVDGELDRGALLQKFYLRILNSLIIYMNNGVTPVLVFDGKAEQEKSGEREKRREARLKQQARIDEIKVEMEKVPNYLRNVKNLGNVPNELREEALKYSALEADLKKIMSTQVSVFYDEIDAIRTLLDNLGIPCIVADNEGEMFCAELGVAGQTAATFSTDSDCLALGIPFYFDEIKGSKKGKGGFINGTMLNPILETLELNMTEFKDFCILLGTDFNSRIPGYGPVKGYGLIKECRTIENIAAKGIDVTPLNYVRTRELLTPKSRDWAIYKLDIDFEKFETLGSTVLAQYMLNDIYASLQEAILNVKSVRYGLN